MLRLLIPAVFIVLFALLIRETLAAVRRPGEKEPDDDPPDLPERLDAAGITEWMHARLVDAYALEQSAWALERVARVEERIYAGVPPEDRIRLVVLWIPEVTAFTFGRHVYLSRRLVERVTTDDAVAFVVAHELGHHALGHLEAREQWLDLFAGLPAGSVLGALIADTVKWRHSPEQELAADEYGLRLCAQLGYDLRACLRVMEVLQEDLLDHGGLDAVFGPVPRDVDAEPGVGDRMRHWLWERQRGYPSLLERRERLDAFARELSAAAAAPATEER